MAKGNRNEVMTGKLGNEVLYRVTNSNNKVQQGSRPYVANVANPKTVSQAVQRMKLAPAKNFYQAIGNEILNHSFEGVKYGGRSHSEFMKLVLEDKNGCYPFVPKDTTQLIPGRFPVSRGSLPGVAIDSIKVLDEYGSRPVCNISLLAPGLDDNTVDEWINTFVTRNEGLIKFGDQITFVALVGDSDNGFYPRIARLVLDSSLFPADAIMVDVFNDVGFSLFYNHIAFYKDTAVEDVPIASAAVIISRPKVSKTNGDVTWLRSDADMFVAQQYLNIYNSQAAFEAAIRSYQPADVNPVSDWYLNEGSAQGVAGGYPVAPGLVSQVVTNKCLIQGSRFFGLWVAKSINGQTGSEKTIANITRSGNTGSIQLYALSNDGTEEGSGTVIYSAGIQEFQDIAANQDLWDEIMEFIGKYETVSAAIAEQAALGNIYTLNS